MAEKEKLGLEVFVEGWKQFERIMEKLDKSVDDFEEGMVKAGKTGGGAFSVAVGTLAANAVSKLADVLVDAGAKVIDFTKDSIDLAADFQDSMAVLGIAASSTGLTFDELKAAALAVGGDTRLLGVSATGAAESLTGLFKAGLTGTEVFGDLNAFMNEGAELGGALRASVDLAAATQLDMVQASDLAAIALSSFGSELETETERAEFINTALDNMVKAADASVAEVDGLAEALKMVGPTAGSAGIPIEDVNNALAILSTRGIEGSMAGTSLNRMLLDLTKTTPKAESMMEKLGISVYDVEGNLLPLTDIVGKFEGALGTATDAEKNAALQAIFTAQGQRAINTLLTEGKDGWNDMATATENAAGIQEQATVMAGTLNAQMEALDGTIETAKIGIGDAFLPVVEDMVGWFTDIVSEYGPQLAEWLQTALPAAIEGAKEAFADISDFVINTLIPGLTDIWTVIEENINPILAGLGAIILVTVVPAFVSWAGAAIAAGAATVAALAPVLVPIAAIGLAVGLLVKAWEEDFLGMRTAITEFWDLKVKPAFEAVREWLAVNIPVATEFLSDIWENTLKPALEIVWEFIQDNLLPLFGALQEFFDVAMTLALTALAGLWENVLKPALKTVWEFIDKNVVPIFETLVEWIEDKLTGAIETATPILEAVKKVFDGIAGAIQWVIDQVKKATAKLKALDLPDWMTPGSPTPLEIGLRGIADAMREVRALSGGVFAGLPGGMAGVTPTASPGTQISSVVNEGDNFNLTTQSQMQPGQLAMEFSVMAMRSR